MSVSIVVMPQIRSHPNETPVGPSPIYQILWCLCNQSVHGRTRPRSLALYTSDRTTTAIMSFRRGGASDGGVMYLCAIYVEWGSYNGIDEHRSSRCFCGVRRRVRWGCCAVFTGCDEFIYGIAQHLPSVHIRSPSDT